MTLAGLKEGEIHICIAHTDQSSRIRSRLQAMLNGDELARSKRFRFEKDRRRYVFSQALLRDVVGQYLSIPANEIIFHTNDFGKPFLSPNIAPSYFSFNMSHSESLVIVGISRNGHVGVDTEFIRPMDD